MTVASPILSSSGVLSHDERDVTSKEILPRGGLLEFPSRWRWRAWSAACIRFRQSR